MLAALPCDLDSTIIERARSGDGRAFAQLVEIYQTPVHNLCYRLLGNAHDAQDAAQEAFLRAYSGLASYNPARPFKTWLFSIAHHHCIDRLRRQRPAWFSLDDEPAMDTASWHSAAPTPEECAVRREREVEIQALLRHLPPKDRGAVIMRYWYDLSYEEIAEATATTVSAVKSRLHRARNVLAPMVAENARPGAARSPRSRPLALSAPAV